MRKLVFHLFIIQNKYVNWELTTPYSNLNSKKLIFPESFLYGIVIAKKVIYVGYYIMVNDNITFDTSFEPIITWI